MRTCKLHLTRKQYTASCDVNGISRRQEQHLICQFASSLPVFDSVELLPHGYLLFVVMYVASYSVNVMLPEPPPYLVGADAVSL